MTAPKRRWSSTLRTLFVVVAVIGIAYGMGWISHRVNERERLLKSLKDRGALTGSVVSEKSDSSLPFLWAAFGVHAIGLIVLPEDAFSAEELMEIATLFPESSIQQRPNIMDMPGSGMGR